MKIKIDGEVFDINPEVLTGILDCMAQTAAQGTEVGFVFCDTPHGIIPGKHCTGDKCSIHLEDCGGKGPIVGSFHTHPVVTSFSQPDYLHGFQEAKEHPQNKHLLCVSLLDKGVRCKALKKLPPPTKSFPVADTEKNRELVKPYYTKRVNIDLDQIHDLLQGVAWENLKPAKEVIAIDEGEGVEIVEKGEICPTAQTYDNLVEQLQAAYKKVLTGQKFKSELQKGKVVMVPIPPAEVVSGPTWVDINEIESPDPTLIAPGEVLGYANAMTPVQLLQKKDAQGRWVIHDGRHRLMGWLAAGYPKVPIVFVKPGEE